MHTYSFKSKKIPVNSSPSIGNQICAGHWWLTPLILATWEAEIRRIEVQGQSGQIDHKNPFPK
jgi:hypothetical protein